MLGCLKWVLALVVMAVIAWFAYLNRDRISGLIDRRPQPGTESRALPSAELAAAADRKLAGLESGRVRVVALSELELQSLLQYKYRALLPAFVDSPYVQLNADKLRVAARVPVDRLPQLGELGDAAAFLPDTTELSITGKLLPLGTGRIALAVDQVRAARIPLPQRLVAGALQRLGRLDEPGLPKDAFAVPLPPGADAAYLRGDSLIFVSNVR